MKRGLIIFALFFVLTVPLASAGLFSEFMEKFFEEKDSNIITGYGFLDFFKGTTTTTQNVAPSTAIAKVAPTAIKTTNTAASTRTSTSPEKLLGGTQTVAKTTVTRTKVLPTVASSTALKKVKLVRGTYQLDADTKMHITSVVTTSGNKMANAKIEEKLSLGRTLVIKGKSYTVTKVGTKIRLTPISLEENNLVKGTTVKAALPLKTVSPTSRASLTVKGTTSTIQSSGDGFFTALRGLF